MSFSIGDSEHDAQTHVIEVEGEVDFYTAPEFKQRLTGVIDSGKTRLVVDLSNATFIDSTTLGVLVGSAKRLRPEGGALAVVCTAPSIRKNFEITGLDRVLAVHSTRDDALSAVAHPDAAGAGA